LSRRAAMKEAAVTLRDALAPAGVAWVAVCLGAAAIAGLFLLERPSGWDAVTGATMVPALGLIWHRAHRSAFDEEARMVTPPGADPNLGLLGLCLGVLTGLGLSIRNGLKGWCNIYLGHEDYWSRRLWEVLGPTYLVCLLAILAWILSRPRLRSAHARRD